MKNFKYNTYSEIIGNRSISIVTNFVEEKNKKIIHTEHRFIFLLSGYGKIKINEKEFEITKNTLISISPWTITEIIDVKEALNFIIFTYNKLYISKIINDIVETEKNIFLDIEDNNIYRFDDKVGENIKNILLDIREEIGDDNILELVDNYQNESFANILIVSKFLEFLVIVSRKKKYNEKINHINESESIIRYIYSHSNEKLTINKLATIFFMSESSVRKHITDFTGLNFNDLLFKIRLSRTEDLLLYTKMTLDEIANIVGFVDGSHITKIWNMKKDISLKQYRNMYQQSFNIFSKEEQKIVFQIINYIENNYAEEIKIEEISKKFNVSEIKINKLLLAYVDRNFSTYLNYIRINKACEMLSNSNKSVIDICFEVGYNNIKTFNNNFSKNKGINPTNYRKNIEDN